MLVSHISAQQHTNATHLARSKRAVQSNLAGYIAICNNNNIGLVICNSDGLFTTTDNNGNTVSNTKCDATGTIVIIANNSQIYALIFISPRIVKFQMIQGLW